MSSSYSSLDFFCHTGSISLCVDLFMSICVYFVCFCFTLHYVLYYCEHSAVDQMGLKPKPYISSFSALTLLVGSFDP